MIVAACSLCAPVPGGPGTFARAAPPLYVPDPRSMVRRAGASINSPARPHSGLHRHLIHDLSGGFQPEPLPAPGGEQVESLDQGREGDREVEIAARDVEV